MSIISYFQTPYNHYTQAYQGSGVHIGNGVVLTAGHVPNRSGGTWIGSLIETQSGGSWSVEGSNKRTHPSFNPDNYGGTYQFDLSMLYVGPESVWGGVGTNGLVKLPSVALWGDAPVLGNEVYMAGWGRRGTGSNPASISSGQFRVGMNTLDARTFNGAIGQIDFDSHLGTTQNLGSSIPLNLEAMIAPGDSGGGWLKLDNGKLALTHINSGVWGNQDRESDGGYTDLGLGVSVSHYMSWIQEQARSLGAIQQGQSLLTVGTNILPQSPAGLSVTAATDAEIALAWSGAQGALNYAVYRDGVMVTTVSGRTYTDTGLQESTLYRYEVAALNTAGEGARSLPVTRATLSYSEQNPRSLQVRSPLAEIEHFSAGYLFIGRAGNDLQDGLTWSNRLSGQTGTFGHSSGSWMVSVPLAPGTNVVDFRGTYNDGPFIPLATDRGDAAVYANGWQTGDNGGSGFSAWELAASAGGENRVANSDLSPGGRLFALWTPPGGTATATRGFTALEDNDSLALVFRHAGLAASGAVGFELVDAEGNARLIFRSAAPGQAGRVQDGAGESAITWTNAATNTGFRFSADGAGAYSLRVGSAEQSGTLLPGGRVAKVKIFSAGASADATNKLAETFDYAAGALLAGQNGGSGFGGAWTGGNSVIAAGDTTHPRWLRIGTTGSDRKLPAAITTGTAPVYFSIIMRSANFAAPNFSGFALTHSSNPGNDLMFFGIPWIQQKFGFDARAGRWPLDIKTIDGLEANRPYLVVCALVPGTVPGKVDVKMWVSPDTGKSPLSLMKRTPDAFLDGEDGRPNFTFDQVRVSGDFLGALELSAVRRLEIPAAETYDFLVGDLKVERNEPNIVQVMTTAPEVLFALDQIEDLDRDGLPDWWETQFFGGTSASPEDDADSDGFTNLAEYRLGTNPVDASSRFGIIGLEQLEDQGVQVRWSSVPGKKYRVVACSSMASGDWTQVGSVVTAQSTESTVTHYPPTNASHFFYRAELVEEEAAAQSVVVPAAASADPDALSFMTDAESPTDPPVTRASAAPASRPGEDEPSAANPAVNAPLSLTDQLAPPASSLTGPSNVSGGPSRAEATVRHETDSATPDGEKSVPGQTQDQAPVFASTSPAEMPGPAFSPPRKLSPSVPDAAPRPAQAVRRADVVSADPAAIAQVGSAPAGGWWSKLESLLTLLVDWWAHLLGNAK